MIRKAGAVATIALGLLCLVNIHTDWLFAQQFETTASIANKLKNANAAQINPITEKATHVGPFFLSEQTVTPHAEEKHLYGLDLNYSDINQVPYVGYGVNTMRLGWNLNALGRIDADYSGIALAWEHRYTLNDNLDGVLVDEFHLLGTSRDAPPEDWRAFSIAKPQLAADATIQTDGAYISTESFALYRSNFTDNALKWQATWSATGGTIAHSAGVGLLFDTPADGTPMMQQRDAAGVALLKLPYLDANETLKIDQPIVAAGGTDSVTGAFLDLTPSSATTGQKGIVLNGPAVTGTYYPVDLQATASTSLVQRLYNTSTAASRATFLAQSAAAEGVASSQYLDGTTGEGAECGWNSSEDRYIIGPWGLLTNTYAAISINPYPATTPTTTILGTCNLPVTNVSSTLTAKTLVEANTAGVGAPNVIVAAESRTTYTNEGATAQNYHTLPAAAAGIRVRFICQDADGIRVVAAGDDTIRNAATVSGAAGFIQSSTIGNVIELEAINATEWFVTSIIGTWTIDS